MRRSINSYDTGGDGDGNDLNSNRGNLDHGDATPTRTNSSSNAIANAHANANVHANPSINAASSWVSSSSSAAGMNMNINIAPLPPLSHLQRPTSASSASSLSSSLTMNADALAPYLNSNLSLNHNQNHLSHQPPMLTINPSSTIDSHDAHTQIMANSNQMQNGHGHGPGHGPGGHGHPDMNIHMNSSSSFYQDDTHNHTNGHGQSHTNTSIHDAARITDWPKVQSLASSHPDHASYKCDHGLTALHHACSRRCPDPAVFKALINAYPHALIEKDYDKGWTPLHHACRFKCPAACVRLLLHSYADFGKSACRVRDQRNGRTPLYYAIRYDAPDGVVELLLDCMEREDILDCDRDGMSVLGLVWDRWAMSFEGKRIIRYYNKILKQWKEQRKDLDYFQENKLESKQDLKMAEEKWWKGVLSDSRTLRGGLKGKLAQNWNKANVLLRGAFKFDLSTSSCEDANGNGNWDVGESQDPEGGRTTRKRKFRVLHAVAAIGCHESLFTMACALYPHQAREIDRGDLFGGDDDATQSIPVPKRRGSVQRPRRKNMALKRGDTEEHAHGHGHGPGPQSRLTALHICSKSPSCGPESRNALQNLILFYPRAAEMSNPADASLPLHYICENESKVHWIQDGIRLLYQAYPGGATALDWKGRTPLHRAATLQESAPTQMMFVTSESQHTNVNFTGQWGIGGIAGAYGNLRVSFNSASTGTASGRTLTSGEASIPSTATISSSRFSITSVEDQAGSIIQNILSMHPEVASIRDTSGKTPFHSIAEYAEEWDRNVQAVYDAYPDALSTRDDTPLRSLPMHLVAANSYAKPSFVRKIVECHPRASSLVNGVGMLPLHLACGAGKTWDEEKDDEHHHDDENDDGDENDGGAVLDEEDDDKEGGGLKDIYEAHPGAIGTVDDVRKWSPLHCAVASSNHTSRETIEKLLELGPYAAHAVDVMGRTPFHLAVESGRGWEDGLDSLFEANPDAIDAPDAQGKIPIVAALLRYCEIDAERKCANDRDHFDGESRSYDGRNIGTTRTGLETMLGPSSLDSTESLDSSPSRAHLLPLEEEPYNDDVSDLDRSFSQGNATINSGANSAVAITAHPVAGSNGNTECNDLAEAQHTSQVNVLFHLLRIAPQVLRPQDDSRASSL